MKYFFTLLISIFILSNHAQTDFAHLQLIQSEKLTGKRKMQQINGAINNYNIVFQRLNLTPNMNYDEISGEVTTHFIAHPNNTNPVQIEFDLANQLNVQSVEYHGNSLNFSHTNNVLSINLPQTAQAGILDSLKINYSGTPPDSGFDSYVTTSHNNVPVVWTLSEPYGAKDWWPCKQDLNDKIDSLEVIIHYPESINNQTMKAVSNGLLISESVNNGIKTSTWKSRYPIATYLVAFAVTNYQEYSQNAGIQQTFPIDNFFYPENSSLNQFQAQQIIPVMNLFENKFGLYPFRNEKYGQAQFGWGGGMEHQTITFLVSYGRQLMAHELGHQWFGDAVTCGSWHDIWLNEGFATYTEGITIENLDGLQDFINWKQNEINHITSQPNGSVYVQDTTNVNRIFDGRLSYAKGGMVLNMLRKKLGNTDFFQGLKNYVNQKMFDYSSTSDFKTIMENTSGINLDEFFNDWIYGEGYPIYNIQVNRSGTHRYQITINQTQSHNSVSFFEMNLPFRFTDNNGNILDIMLENTTNGQTFEIDTGFDATEVLFDPEHDIITKNPIINANLSINNLANSEIEIYPVPTQDYLFLKNNKNIDIDKIEIYSLSGKKIKTIHSDFQKINVKGMSKGLYFIHLYTQRKVFISKIVIK